MIDMPERMLNNLFGFLRQNNGRLSKRAQEKQFSRLTEDEVKWIEELYRASFGEGAVDGQASLFWSRG